MHRTCTPKPASPQPCGKCETSLFCNVRRAAFERLGIPGQLADTLPANEFARWYPLLERAWKVAHRAGYSALHKDDEPGGTRWDLAA